MKRILIALLAIGLLCGAVAYAQQNIAGAPITFTAQRGDTSAPLVTATAVATAAATATATPPNGQYLYMTMLVLSVCGDDTGDAAAATPATFTYGGFGVAVIHKLNSLHTAGVCTVQVMPFPTPVRSAAAGVAGTVTSSSATHMIPSIQIYGYYAP